MRRVMVRYKLKPDQVAENERLTKQVFEQLERERTAGVQYATFKLDDGVSFVHVASIAVTDASNPLTDLSAFKAFTADIKERCEEPPVSVKLNVVGAYNFFEQQPEVASSQG